MRVTKLGLPRQSRCTTAVVSLIAALGCQQVANADPGDGDPAKAAFGNTVSFATPYHGGTKLSVPLAQVPSGKRYVIELVSFQCSRGSIGAAVLTVGQRVPGGNSVSTQSFSIPFEGILAARMYADDITGSPSDVLLTVFHDGFYPMECAASISGYLVSLHGEGD